MSDALPFGTRLWFAWVAFFKILFDGEFAAKCYAPPQLEAPKEEPKKEEPKKEEPKKVDPEPAPAPAPGPVDPDPFIDYGGCACGNN